jgi:7-carboxy-7-deazaguanine synthase
MIETIGQRFVGVLPREVIKIVNVKYPDSGEPGAPNMANLEVLDGKDEVKFMMASRRDYDFVRDFATRHILAEQVHQVLLSPVFADSRGKWLGSDVRGLANWILADGLQLHKFIWDPARKGV